MSTNWAKVKPQEAPEEVVKQAKGRAKKKVEKEAVKEREIEASDHEALMREAEEEREREAKPTPVYFPLEALKERVPAPVKPKFVNPLQDHSDQMLAADRHIVDTFGKLENVPDRVRPMTILQNARLVVLKGKGKAKIF